ncbi:adenine deaminase [Paenibacillus aquistagni]|uniref:Adenine deaminase n=1 Tax=Paenibacillus aquistagni TaxID=1852522 RepID=A0A1X7KR81_9BACL|nr:adenine deaminase [Paenibacillus aquistagni]SMG44119.1 Adenine deaminase [Paenibacillus aquistagni]
MRSNKEQLARSIRAAGKQERAELVIRNANIVDVFNLEIMKGDVAITNGRIVGIGDYEGEQVINADGKYLVPAFIDAHVHIESSMVTPAEFARAILPHGVTTVITDPHEIANVSGEAGIQYMLDASEELPLDVRVMLPSCVPATPFEHAGAVLGADQLKPFYSHPRVLGLAEVMDYPSVANGSDDMLNKLLDADHYRGHIDGHGAGLHGDAINVYAAAGIVTDHECVNAGEAKERLRRGMYLMLREGSVAKDVKALLPAVTPFNVRRCMFCTDDKHLDELVHEGSIDHNVRLAIQEGLNPLMAIQMASLNAAECFQLEHKGAIAPGYDADLLIVDDLEKLHIHQVYRKGELIAEGGQYVGAALPILPPPADLLKSVRLDRPEPSALHIPLKVHGDDHKQEALCRLIGIIPNQLITNHMQALVKVENGQFVPSIDKDQLKIAVLERHKKTGNVGLGVVHGFGIQRGAIASTVAHDSHNLVVAGTCDEDMLLAIEALQQAGGGLAIACDGKVHAVVELTISGLLSAERYEHVLEQLEKLHQALKEIGASDDFHPFVTLSFLCLPVIPELKLTDMGLFDFHTFSTVPFQVEIKEEVVC